MVLSNGRLVCARRSFFEKVASRADETLGYGRPRRTLADGKIAFGYFGHFAPPKLERYAREVDFCAQAAAKKSHVAPCGIEDLVSLGARRRLPAAPWKIVVNFCAQAAEIMLVAFATLARFARF